MKSLKFDFTEIIFGKKNWALAVKYEKSSFSFKTKQII